MVCFVIKCCLYVHRSRNHMLMLVLCIMQKVEVKVKWLFSHHLNKVTRLALVHVSKDLTHISTFCYFKDEMPHEHPHFQSLRVFNLVLIQHTDSTVDLTLIHSFISDLLELNNIWAMQREDTAPGIRDIVLDMHDFHKPVIYYAIMV